MSDNDDKQLLDITNNETLTKIITELQSKLKKIDTLEIYSKKTNDSLISHEIRISNNANDILENQSKFDKIFNENLSAPGFIGQSCQFKTISSCLKSIINDYNRIKIDLEHAKKETRDFKNKVNAVSKSNLRLIENAYERCKEYTDNKFKDMQGDIVNKINEFFDKNMEMRMKIYEFQAKTEEQINSVKKEFAELKNIKNEFNEKINKITKEIKKDEKPQMDEINKNEIEIVVKEKMENLEKDINEMKTNFEKKLLEDKDIISGQKNAEFDLKKIKTSINNLEHRINAIEKMNICNENNYKNNIVSNNQKLKNNNNNNNNVSNTNNNIIQNYNFKKSNNNSVINLKNNISDSINNNINNNFYSNSAYSGKENKTNAIKNCRTMKYISQNGINRVIVNNYNNNKFLSKKNKLVNTDNVDNSNTSSDNILNEDNSINKAYFFENENNNISLKHHQTKSENKFNKSTFLPNFINKKNTKTDDDFLYSTFSKSQKTHKKNSNITITKYEKSKQFNFKNNQNDDEEEKKVFNNIYFNSSLNEGSNGIIFSNLSNSSKAYNKSFFSMNDSEKKLSAKEKIKIKIGHKIKDTDLFLDRVKKNFDICNNNKTKNEIYNEIFNNNSKIYDKEKDENDEKIMEEFFTKNNFNKNNISNNLAHFKNNASFDLYNFSISPPETNEKKNKFELPSFTERFLKGKKIFSSNAKYNITENKETKNKNKSNSVQREKTKTKNFIEKIKAELPKKISPAFGSTAYVEFDKKDDFINNVYLKNK